jgi:catechol 2,3-dioxygenase-like lactoylglutathione lyase family enzyme
MSERTHSLVTILPCNNVARSLAFYRRLGFRLVLGDEEYAMLEDGRGAQIHLQPAVEGWLVPGRNPFGVYLYTEQVDDLAREFADDILNSRSPEDKPWGMYEFALSDPDETLVRIGWPTRLRAGTTAS